MRSSCLLMPTQPPLAKGMRKAEGEKGGRKAQFDQIRPSILWCSSVLSSVLPHPPPPPFPHSFWGKDCKTF